MFPLLCPLVVNCNFRRHICQDDTGELYIPTAYLLACIFMPGHVDTGVTAKNLWLGELKAAYQPTKHVILEEREDHHLPPMAGLDYTDHLVRIVMSNPGGFETYADHDDVLDHAFVHLEFETLGGRCAEVHEEWPRLMWYLGADPKQVLCRDMTKVIPQVTEKIEASMEEWFEVDPCRLDVAGCATSAAFSQCGILIFAPGNPLWCICQMNECLDWRAWMACGSHMSVECLDTALAMLMSK